MSRSKDAWGSSWKYPIGYGQFDLPAQATTPLIAQVKSYEVIVLDTETTGLTDLDRIVEIAAAKVRMPSGEILEKKREIIDPGIPIPLAASQIHGITDDMVRGKETAKDVLPRVVLFVGQLPIVAHNAPFDMKMLKGEFLRAGIAPPDWQFYCSLKVAKKMLRELRGLGNLKLKTLAEHFKVPEQHAHRAMGDVTTLIGVLVGLNSLGEAGSFFEVHGASYTFGGSKHKT